MPSTDQPIHGYYHPDVKRRFGQAIPNRLYVLVPNLDRHQAEQLAKVAASRAQWNAPKLTGRSAQRIRPYFGAGFFGVQWADPRVWFQEAGTRGHTMRNLAGKVIPMWLDDPTGKLHRENPKAKTRITESGKRQVLIFRRAAKIGARKMAMRGGVMTSVPQSYPGAPGRIVHREFRYDGTQHGMTTGRIARRMSQPNIGVRWYNPGINARKFLHHAIHSTCRDAGLGTPQVHALYEEA